MIVRLLIVAMLAQVGPDLAERCARTYRADSKAACAELHQREAAASAQAEKERLEAEAKERALLEEAQRDQEVLERQQATETTRRKQAVAQLRKECGPAYRAVSVGMDWETVRKCSGPFRIRFDGGTFKVYQGPGGQVRVEAGKVARVFYK